jgi:hypothetical protein
MFAGNVTGTGGYDSRQLSFGFASLYLNDSEAQLLNQIVEKYQVALSRGVQAAQSFYYNSAYSNESNTYLYSTQITGTTQVSAINTLINGLKANNLWTKMKAVYPFVTDKTLQADMAAQMKFNLVNPQDTDAAFRLAFSGGWTYSTNGAQPNGTNGYADTKLNLLTNLPGYNNSFSVYFRQNLYGTYKVGALGSSFDQGMSAHLGWTNSSGTLYHDNLGRNTMANSAYGTFDAYHISSVTSTSSQKLYRNGVMKLSGAATSGLTQPSINFYFGAANNNGTAAYFDPKQIAFGTLSTSLTDDEAALLYQLVQEFQTTLSRQV